MINEPMSEAFEIQSATWSNLSPTGKLNVTFTSRGTGKSWVPWLWLLRNNLHDTPEQELRAACEWAVRNTGKPPGRIFAEPRVFPVLKSSKRVA